ncbi:MAG: hypothetical protein BWY59_02505 [Verrucomicrobia bacterium ADurb.Bin345]|nr:MAG: hypothetical protein BWY59_02505 [Verrucomicrobia bacterium ADurb.Bin345]
MRGEAERSAFLQQAASNDHRRKREGQPAPHSRLHRERRLLRSCRCALQGPAGRGRGSRKDVRVARPWRRGISDRPQMAASGRPAGPQRKIPCLQRGRRRSRRLHGPLCARGQSSKHYRRHDYRRLRHGRDPGRDLCSQRISARHHAPDGSSCASSRARAPRRKHSRHGLLLRHLPCPRRRRVRLWRGNGSHPVH